jgi:DNA-binding XRE family transcriptional regulator
MRQHENNNFLNNFSAILRRHRGDRSQAEMARLLSIPNQQTYQRYEAAINEPLTSVAHAICRKLGVNLEDLFKGETVNLVKEAPADYDFHSVGKPNSQTFPQVQDAIDFIANQLGIDKVKVLEAIIAAVKESAMDGKQ